MFHIGCDKTGTTSLQRCLRAHHATLKRHSVLYPKRNLAFDGLNHTPLVAAFMPENAADGFLRVPPAGRDAVVASLQDEIDAASEQTILVSAEHFSTRFRGDQIEALRARFQAYDCSCVLVLRDHMSRFASGYATHVASGGCLTLDGFADEVLLPGNIYLRYDEMIAPWAMVFGQEKVRLLVYGADTIPAILADLGIGPAAVPDTTPYRTKASDRIEVTAALRLVNLAIAASAPAGGDLAWWRASHLRRDIVARLRASSLEGPPRTWNLEPSRLSQLEEIARNDRAWLETTYGLRLPVDAVATPTPAENDAEAAAVDLLAGALVAQSERSWRLAGLPGRARWLAQALHDRLAPPLVEGRPRRHLSARLRAFLNSASSGLRR